MANIQPWGNASAPASPPVAGVTSGWFQQNSPSATTPGVAGPYTMPMVDVSTTAGGGSPLTLQGQANQAQYQAMFDQAGAGSSASQMPAGGFTSVAQYVDYLAAQPGSTVGNDKQYWIAQITNAMDPAERAALGNGGTLSAGTIGYWNDKVNSTGAGGVGGGGGFSGGMPQGYSNAPQTGKYPLSPVTGPGLAQAFNTPFVAPTGTDDPGFAFAMQQGQQALDRENAANGKLLTGGAIKDALDYSTGKALQGYSDAYNRAWQQYMGANQIYNQNANNIYSMLAGQQNVGLNATGAVTNAGQNYGTNATNAVTGQGNANAGANVAKGNVNATTIGNIAKGTLPYITPGASVNGIQVA